MGRTAGDNGELGRVPVMLQDRQYLLGDPGGVLLVRPTSWVDIADGPLRDGPASDRVAVVGTGRARARLLPPVGKRGIRMYAFDEGLMNPDREDAARFEDETFVRLHVFGCV